MKHTSYMILTNVIAAVLAILILIGSLLLASIGFALPDAFEGLEGIDPDSVTAGFEVLAGLFAGGLMLIGVIAAFVIAALFMPYWLLLGAAAITGCILLRSCRKAPDAVTAWKRIKADCIVKIVLSSLLLIYSMIIGFEFTIALIIAVLILAGGILVPSICNLHSVCQAEKSAATP